MSGSSHTARKPLFTLNVTPVRLLLGLVVLAAVAAIPAVVVSVVVGSDSPATSSDGPGTIHATLAPGATLGSGQTRVVIKNTWGGPNEPNVVVSAGPGGAGERDAWRFVLDDGTALAPTIADWPNGEAYLRLERGVPSGRSVVRLLYRPEGGPGQSFDYQ